MKNTKISVFKDLFKSSDVPYIVTLEKVFRRIKEGTSKDIIEKVRKGHKEKKKKLPCIIFSGQFNERKAKGMVAHSGLMVLDFDEIPSKKELLRFKDELKKNKHTVAVFLSPSGKGLKCVVRVKQGLTAEEHTGYFKAFLDDFDYEYIDAFGSDVNRVCFESYDPNIYVNYDADIYETELKDEGYSYTNRAAVMPVTNQDDIIDRIVNFKWKKEFIEGQRNNFIFDLAGAFCEYGVGQYAAENYLINATRDMDFPEKEILNAVKSAYKVRTPNTKYFEDYRKLDRVKKDLGKGKKLVIDKYQISDEVYDSVKQEKEHEDFWYLNQKGFIEIDPLKYKSFLERNGFKKYFNDGADKPTWVKVTSNKVRETSPEKIKDFVLGYLLDSDELDVWRKCVKYQGIFEEKYLLMLDSIDLIMLRDTRTSSFIAYSNGILEVTRNGCKLVDYIDVDGYVWESQIINREFKKIDNYENEYKSFINNVSSQEPLPIESVIGYLLCTYKNKTNNKAIILNDEVISDNPEGGTGKGLFIQGIKEIRNVSILDGKAHDDKKSFPYQTVSQDTQVLVFDDVKKNFSFESKFSLVTEGITLERKNKDAIKLNVEDSPKLVISTNYAIKGEGNSHSRRRHEIELANYYGANKTPFDEFGHQLFSDWDEDMYLKFDNYMVKCLMLYLDQGLIHQNAKNLEVRKFIAETSMEFYEWSHDKDNLKQGERLYKPEQFDSFVDEYKDYKRWLSRRKFVTWLKKYASFTGQKYIEGNSNGLRWFEIGDKKEIEINDIMF